MVLQRRSRKVCSAVIWFMIILDLSISELASGWVLSSAESRREGRGARRRT
jgi:hypothetical protein